MYITSNFLRWVILRQVKSFGNVVVLFSSFGYFWLSFEGNEPLWIVRCRAHLILCALLTRFASVALSIVLEYTVLGLPDCQGSWNVNEISWLYCDHLCLHLLYYKYFLLLLQCYGSVQISKALVPGLNFIACPSVWLLNHIWCEAMHNLLAHHLLWYYQSLWVI